MVLQNWRPRWGIIQRSPLRDIEDWQRQLEEFMGRSFGRWTDGEGGWMPSIDVFEKDGKLMVKAELPGMKEEDIDVSVSDNSLIIRGEKKSESEVNEENYYRSERSYGSFYRSIPLPSKVEADKIEANFEDGVLEVSLPKSAEVKPKKVAVSARKKLGTKEKAGKKTK